MTAIMAALAVVDLLNRGLDFVEDAKGLAALIGTARKEDRDLTPEEAQPYLDKLDRTIDMLDEQAREVFGEGDEDATEDLSAETPDEEGTV